MKFEAKMVPALFLGGALSGAIIHALGYGFLAMCAGFAGGALFGWVLYAWQDICREVPIALKKALEHLHPTEPEEKQPMSRRDMLRQKAGRWYLLALATVLCSGFLLPAVLPFGPVYLESSVVFEMAFVILCICTWHVYTIEKDEKNRRGYAHQVRLTKRIVKDLNPITIWILMPRFLVWLVIYFFKFIWAIALNLAKALVRAHTRAAGVAAVYAGSGGIIASLLEQSWWVVPYGGCIALGLGILTHLLALYLQDRFAAFAKT